MATDLDKLVKRRYLLCLSTAVLPRKVEISKDKFIVGSTAGSDLRVPSRNVKKDHAIIRISGNYCYIKILNSDGRTCVNTDTLIKEECRALRSQDNIIFGDVRYRYIEGIN